MAFDIILQINNSDKNKLDKNLVEITTITGTLKKETSVINPVILIETPLENIISFNYLTIPTFNRSYYVTDIKSIRTNLAEISCHVDVLQSYREQIKENTAIVRKQENKWNLYLNDGSFRVYQNPQVITREFPSGFNTQQFILAVAGS